MVENQAQLEEKNVIFPFLLSVFPQTHIQVSILFLVKPAICQFDPWCVFLSIYCKYINKNI